jgi:tetratricopeptide (TPR) repeat protein
MTPQQILDAALTAHRGGDLAEAGRLYRHLLEAAPGHVGALHMLGVVCAQQGLKDEAVDLLSRVVALTPSDALALSNFGNALWETHRFARALEVLDRAVAIAPHNPDAWNSRGNVLAALGRQADALASFDRALALRPLFALAHKNKGDVLQQSGRSDEAIRSYDRALAADTHFAPALLGKGVSLRSQARYQEALETYDRLLRLTPDDPAALNNRAVCLQNLGRLDEAARIFREVISHWPDMVEPHLNLATLFLLQERFSEGFPLKEWRKKMQEPVDNRPYPQPLWTGAEPLKDKTLFVYIEQGLGDAIMFYRFALVLRDRCRRLVMAVHPSLLQLFRSNGAGIELIGSEEDPGDFDFHIPLASLPLALGTQSTSIPFAGPYLFADADRKAQWKARIGEQGFRIGVAWEGNSAIPGAEGKSFRLDQLARISRLEGVRLINLQKYGGSEQLNALPGGMVVESFEFDESADAFLDTAAIMRSCDLVIACDTGPAHLAGALGVPCWVALKHIPDWRWFLSRSNSPWYSSMRLFRQERAGRWDDVFAAMEEQLGRLTAR